jgi:hypothetical protein
MMEQSHTQARQAHSHRMGMDSMIWREMYGNGAGIGMIAVIIAAVRGVTRVDLLQAPPACCGAVAGAASPTARGAHFAAAARLTTAATVSASVACAVEVSRSGERSDKQVRGGAAPVRR